MNLVAIGRVVLTGREHIIALEPLDKGLMGTLLRYPYEGRSAHILSPLRLPVPPRPLWLRDQILSAFSGEVELG
jgi:hypothetical protein